jgi:hypothetical protein
MRIARRRTAWGLVGLSLALALHVAGVWGARIVWAQVGPGGGGTTFSATTEFVNATETPPTCSVIGSTRVEDSTPITTTSVGPLCIGIGDRSANVTNPSPACIDYLGPGIAPPADPPHDPFHGNPFVVVTGNINVDVYTVRTTYTCVAAVPALPRAAWIGLAGVLAGGSVWWLRRGGLSSSRVS